MITYSFSRDSFLPPRLTNTYGASVRGRACARAEALAADAIESLTALNDQYVVMHDPESGPKRSVTRKEWKSGLGGSKPH